MSCIAVSGPGVPCRCCGPFCRISGHIQQASEPSSSCVLIVRKPSRYLSVSAHAESDCTEDQMPTAEGFARPHQRRGRMYLCLKVCKQSPASLALREVSPKLRTAAAAWTPRANSGFLLPPSPPAVLEGTQRPGTALARSPSNGTRAADSWKCKKRKTIWEGMVRTGAEQGRSLEKWMIPLPSPVLQTINL